MPMEFCDMSQEPPSKKLKLALVGYEQNGKSRLASTARKPILFHDFDNKRESLAGIPDVYVISYVDPIWPAQPTASNDFLTIIGKLERSLDLHELGFKCPPGTILKTNVIDSMQTLAKACNRYALHTNGDLRREINFGGHKVFINKGWDAVNAEMQEVENFTLRLLALPTDTIVIMHETEEEAADSTPEKKKFTGRVDVYPPRMRALLKYFPDVWRVKLTQVAEGNKMAYLPRVFPKPNYEFDAGTPMLLDDVENPNIFEMLQKNEKRLAALPTGQQSLGANSSKALTSGVK